VLLATYLSSEKKRPVSRLQTHKGVHKFLNTLMFVLLGSVKLKKVPAQHQHTGAQHVELQCAQQQALNRTGSVLPVILG
jgi:hypothetical protein